MKKKLCSSSSSSSSVILFSLLLLCLLTLPSSLDGFVSSSASSESNFRDDGGGGDGGETTTIISSNSAADSLDQNESPETTTTGTGQEEEEEEEEDDEEVNDYVTRTKTTADCHCGIANTGFPIDSINLECERRHRSVIDTLIIPACEAGVREFPWIVAITKKKWDGKQHVVCGGSLINSRFVVTAAHCIKNQPLSRMEVAFNVHNTTSMTNDAQVEIKKIRRFIVHPQWNQQTVDNDIGLIELVSPIDYSVSSVRPICLPVNRTHSEFDGQNATVSGWGYTVPSGPNSKVLNKITVPILSDKQCREHSIYKDKILDSMLCAGYLEGGRDACTNDSGGPLVVQEGDRNILVGLVSWGHGCAKPKAPGVYTRVTRYVDWIEEKVARGDWCQARRRIK